MNKEEKIEHILYELAYSNHIAEDSQSRDYCIYCGNIYGNVKYRAETHKEDCIHRLATEILADGIVT
jgi:hypothetical protein